MKNLRKKLYTVSISAWIAISTEPNGEGIHQQKL